MTSEPWTDFVPLSHRYGYVEPVELARWFDGDVPRLVEELWRARHSSAASTAMTAVDLDPLTRCICPGGAGHCPCSERAVDERHLCEACAQHCWAVSGAGAYLRLIEIHGAAG